MSFVTSSSLLQRINSVYEAVLEDAIGMCSCSLKDDFLRALEALMEQRQRFDYILVETTGTSVL